MGTIITAKVKLNNYRYPKDRVHFSGQFAIVLLNIVELVEGEIPNEAYTAYGNKSIIVRGELPHLVQDAVYTLKAEEIIDPTWGIQYRPLFISMDYQMDSKEDQKKFLSFFLTEKQIESLYENYDNPIALLRTNNIEELIKIKGIGRTTAARICMRYSDNIHNGKAYVRLKGLGLTKYAIDNLVREFGSADTVIDIIENNPYLLIKYVRGYGWEKADKIALSRGFGRDSRERCVAYTRYRLEKEASVEGNSCMVLENLFDEILEVCYPITKANAAQYVKEETVGVEEFEKLYERIVNGERGITYPSFFYSNKTKEIGLFVYRLIERKIMAEFKRLKEAAPRFYYDKEVCEQLIAETEKEQGFNYTPEQKQAIWNILNNNLNILTGSSGTGKSSTVKPLIKIFQHYNLNIAQCALSGRAASVLTEYTGLEGKTIHRLLKYSPETEEYGFTKENPLLNDVIILDETSMVGEELFLKLIEAIRSGSKLIMLGDIKQLPPISVVNILSDCLASGYVKTNVLTIIQRQALKSGIISQSVLVTQGKPLVKSDFSGSQIRGELSDFKIICDTEALIVHNNALEEFKELLKQGVSPDKIQILVTTRAKGMNSCRMFNAEIQQLVNGGKKRNCVVEVMDGGIKFEVTYKVDDKIMVVKNNYHAKTIGGSQVPIFNGYLGKITKIESDYMIVRIDNVGDIILNQKEWGNITHGWACTTYKFQGSQCDYAIVCLDTSSYMMLTREWLYTAITRAKKYCILVGQPKAINTACRTSNIKIKHTWLRDELNKIYMEQFEKKGEEN